MTERRSPLETRPPPVPQWVKVLALGFVLVMFVVLVVMVVSGGGHGPWQHGG